MKAANRVGITKPITAIAVVIIIAISAGAGFLVSTTTTEPTTVTQTITRTITQTVGAPGASTVTQTAPAVTSTITKTVGGSEAVTITRTVTESAEAGEKVLNVGLPDLPNTLDAVQYGITLTSEAPMLLIHDGLFWLAPGGVTPQLVTGFRQDGSRWIFTLAEGVRFSDGTSFNATAVVETMKRQTVETDPLTGQASNRFSSYQIFKEVTALDTYTVAFETENPNPTVPALLAILGGSITSPSAVIKYGADYGTSADKTSGAGPYMPESFTPDVELVLVRNPHYWEGRGSGTR